MATIKVKQALIAGILSKDNIVHDIEQLADKLPLIGTDIDVCNNEDLEIEIFPDRPDLLSAETLSHAIGPFIHNVDSKPELEVVKGDITVKVDPSLKNIRPQILAAIVRGVKTGEGLDNEEFIKGLMDHQEKLHFALARGRRRASIGVHDLANLEPPFVVKSVTREFMFTPLGSTSEMTIDEVLNEHPKGVEYAHLLKGMDKVPVILDSNDAVLSFPPVINGEHTTVTSKTTDFFIDVTGLDARSCESCLLLICLQLAARGGIVESVEITDCNSTTFTSPNGKAVSHQIPMNLVKNILGWDFTEEELGIAITRMGGRYIGSTPSLEDSSQDSSQTADTSSGGMTLHFEMPRWRFDILHPVDLVEELAIGHGYENLGTATPSISMAGIPRPDANMCRRIRTSLQGLGLQQVQSLTLSNDKDQFLNTRWTNQGQATRITNPITGEHTLLRQSVLPSLLRLIAANRHNDLPQKVYELGTCVRDHENRPRVSWLVADTDASFADCRGYAQALLADLGVDKNRVVWKAVKQGEGPWLGGRAANIFIDDKLVGEIGELDPFVSESFSLKVPMHGGEFDVSTLIDCIQDPVM